MHDRIGSQELLILHARHILQFRKGLDEEFASEEVWFPAGDPNGHTMTEHYYTPWHTDYTHHPPQSGPDLATSQTPGCRIYSRNNTPPPHHPTAWWRSGRRSGWPWLRWPWWCCRMGRSGSGPGWSRCRRGTRRCSRCRHRSGNRSLCWNRPTPAPPTRRRPCALPGLRQVESPDEQGVRVGYSSDPDVIDHAVRQTARKGKPD